MGGRTCWDIDVLKGRAFIEYFIRTVTIIKFNTNFTIKDSNRSQIVALFESICLNHRYTLGDNDGN